MKVTGRLHLALYFLSIFQSTVAVLRNCTIDDTYGDPVTGRLPEYSPPDKFARGHECPSCGVQPDKTRAYNRTWHDATATAPDDIRTITLRFNGTLRVMCTCVAISITNLTQCNRLSNIYILHRPELDSKRHHYIHERCLRH
jgi:hypothetical protein